MSIEANREKVRNIINNATEVGSSKFKSSIRAIYGISEKEQPCHIGSCILLSIGGKKYLLTAAHIIDDSKVTPLYVYGATNELVGIQGEFLVTNKAESGRAADHYDFAWARLSDELIKSCGENDFIPEERICNGKENPIGRIYLALGYPCSKSKPNIFKKTITPGYFRYADTVKSDDSLCKKLGVSGREHFFLNYNFKHYLNDNGDLTSAIEPQGISGGALVDMGMFTDWYKLANKPTGKLAGMLIEKQPEHKAMVAVKINTIVNLIKQKEGQGNEKNLGSEG